MAQGICINSGLASVLEAGKKYYLFQNGENHYYVSRFNNKESHFGCFQKKYFDLIQPEPGISPETDAVNIQLSLFD